MSIVNVQRLMSERRKMLFRASPYEEKRKATDKDQEARHREITLARFQTPKKLARNKKLSGQHFHQRKHANPPSSSLRVMHIEVLVGPGNTLSSLQLFDHTSSLDCLSLLVLTHRPAQIVRVSVVGNGQWLRMEIRIRGTRFGSR